LSHYTCFSCTLTTFLGGKSLHCLLFSLIQQALRTSFQNFEVAQLKAQVSRLKEELNAAQKVIAHLHQQNPLRQQMLTPEKCDRFLKESFRVTEFP
ncbi:hypothetical protein, partial [Microcoleus sp.]|uniref:hypothetical protein n=1 Tax=Microcoleus sp. TaxID=44472 RepID=UPI00403E5CC1